MKNKTTSGRPPSILERLFVWIAILSFALCCSCSSGASLEEETWQGCDYFVAPTTMGWGVYAARPFRQSEIVSIAPLFMPVVGRAKSVRNSVLDDYIYGYSGREEYHSNVIFGPDMVYNHHPVPNVAYSGFGYGSRPHATGFKARRDIAAGEQLFSTYGDEDGGEQWFAKRRIEMQAPDESQISGEELPAYKVEFCSKIQAGIGLPGFEGLPVPKDLRPSLNIMHRLAPFDAGYGDAKAKVSISQGERIELSVGLVIPGKQLEGNVLRALAVGWQDLKDAHQTSIRDLRESGKLKVQYQGDDTHWERIDRFTTFEDLTILPISGGLATVRRVGDSQSNCRLVIKPEMSQSGSVGVALELIATEDIAMGEALKLDLPPVGFAVELALLQEELELTGQPYYSGLFPDTREEL